jgi:hypothetical protein
MIDFFSQFSDKSVLIIAPILFLFTKTIIKFLLYFNLEIKFNYWETVSWNIVDISLINIAICIGTKFTEISKMNYGTSVLFYFSLVFSLIFSVILYIKYLRIDFNDFKIRKKIYFYTFLSFMYLINSIQLISIINKVI